MKQNHLKYALDKKLRNSYEVASTHSHIENNQIYTLQHFISKLKQHEPMGHESHSTVHQNLKKIHEQFQKSISLTTDQLKCRDKVNYILNSSLDTNTFQKRFESCTISLKKKRRRQKKKLPVIY